MSCASKTIRCGFKEFRAGAVAPTDKRSQLSTSKYVFDCSLIRGTALRLDKQAAAERTAAKPPPKASYYMSRLKAATNLKRWRRAATVKHGQFLENGPQNRGPCEFSSCGAGHASRVNQYLKEKK
jgi:hypothetical protein